MAKDDKCKNCEAEFSGNFCPSCGQSAHTKRIDLHYIVHDIPHSILHIDKGLPYTFYQLIVNPGKSLLEYLKGKRIRFFKPFAYVVILSTLSSLFLKFTSQLTTTQTATGILSFIAHYPSLLVFALIPILSLISWIIFRSKGFNYWEHFLVHTYLAAQINIILVIMNLLSITGVLYHLGIAVKLSIFNTFFMSYHGYTFSSLFTNNYQERFNTSTFIRIGVCCFLLGCVYAFTLSYTGIAKMWF